MDAKQRETIRTQCILEEAASFIQDLMNYGEDSDVYLRLKRDGDIMIDSLIDCSNRLGSS